MEDIELSIEQQLTDERIIREEVQGKYDRLLKKHKTVYSELLKFLGDNKDKIDPDDCKKILGIALGHITADEAKTIDPKDLMGAQLVVEGETIVSF